MAARKVLSVVIAVAKCGQVERIERQEQAECHIGPVYGGKGGGREGCRV